MHSLQALALMQENRIANVGARFARIQRSPSSTDWPGSNGTSWFSNCPACGVSPRQIRNRAVAPSVPSPLPDPPPQAEEGKSIFPPPLAGEGRVGATGGGGSPCAGGAETNSISPSRQRATWLTRHSG